MNTKDVIANVVDENATAQYLVNEVIGGEVVAPIGCISLYADGTAYLADLNPDGTISDGQTIKALAVTKRVAAHLFGEEPHFCSVVRF